MRELKLGLLGGFRLETADGQPVPVPTKKAKALLAYLALHGEPQPRTKLAHILWEDSDEPQARESLRQTLFLLRKALSPAHADALMAQNDVVALQPVAIKVDVIEFERLVASGEPVLLDEAVQLYRGDFLEGFDLSASGFDAWLGMERQRLKERALAALQKLLAHRLANNAIESAITVATRLLLLDPLREGVHRSLMELFCKQGRHAAALRQFRVCAETLKKELGVEPDVATVALYREIRQQRHRLQTGGASPFQAELPDVVVEPLPIRRSPQAVERRHLTVLACDLVGLSAASERVKPEELHTIVAGINRCCREVLSRFDGTMLKFSGDGLVACFGYPEAHEHAPERAIRAGLALIEAIPASSSKLTAPIHARIGIAAGSVVLGDFADQGAAPVLLGEASRFASLLQSIAEPDAVLITASTRDLVRGLFEYRAVSPVTAAGFFRADWDLAGHWRERRRDPL